MAEKITKLLVVSIIICTIFTCGAEAKGISGKIKDNEHNTYIVKDGKVQYGLIRYHGNIYYAYHSTSRMHKKGSLAKECFKVVGGKWYYFTHSGKALDKDTEFIDIRHKNKTVRNIVTPGTGGKQRYNTTERRYQVKTKGKWKSVGQQCYPFGQVDWQW